MDLLEHEGKALFARHSVAIPKGVVVLDLEVESEIRLVLPMVVKAQVRSSGRGRAGGVHITRTIAERDSTVHSFLGATVCGERCDAVLIEEYIDAVAEYYMSFSYDTSARGPVLAIARSGGVDVGDATVVPVHMAVGATDTAIVTAFERERIPPTHCAALADTIRKLWTCFVEERALLVEINPLFITRDGRAVAGDAKVVLDDDVVRPQERRFLSLGGDIAILASGGGASLLNIDALMQHGGKPANYTEYSGNPLADVVRDLTVRVLSQSNVRGCWAVGGTANFTDIYETMRGFVDGLRLVQPKPTYPIVIRRDGPRQREAFDMLRDVAEREGYQLYTFGSETPMEESARLMVKLAYGEHG